jgi:hypothetical protein
MLVPLLMLATTCELAFSAMNYGAKFFFSSLATARRPGWIALSLVLHFLFAYRTVSVRTAASSQRAEDLDRFRRLLSK